jgi:putative ABC transport system permease protein
VQLFKPWDFAKGFAHLPEMPRDHRFLRAAARLSPGSNLSEAQAEMDVIARSIATAHPATNAGWGVALVPMRDAIVGEAKTGLWILLGAVGCVLLLACANVTSLLLVRASGRSREMAVRTALGASRIRLARQLLFESLLIGGLGGTLGVGLAWLGIDVLLGIRPGALVLVEDAGIDLRVLVFAVSASLVAALIAGLTPAIQASSHGPVDALKETGGAVSSDRVRQRLKTLIIVSEIAVAVVLLAGAGVFLQSFSRVRAVELGFDPNDLLVARMRLDAKAYGGGGAHPYYTRLLERLRALPGVASAGGTTGLPMDELDIDFDRPFWRDDEPRPAGGGAGVQVRMATIGYFETMRIPLVEGRMFDERDDRSRPRILIVNKTMAERTWRGAAL